MTLLALLAALFLLHPVLLRRGLVAVETRAPAATLAALAAGLLLANARFLGWTLRDLRFGIAPELALPRLWLAFDSAALLLLLAYLGLLAATRLTGFLPAVAVSVVVALGAWLALTRRTHVLVDLVDLGVPVVLPFLLWPALGVAAFLLLVVRPAPAGAPSRSPLHQREAVLTYRSSTNEPLRLIEGAAVCGRLPEARALLADDFNRTNARAPDMGVPRARILEAVRRRARRRLGRSAVYAGLAVLFLLAIAAAVEDDEALVLPVIVAVAAAIYHLTRLYKDRYRLAADYTPAAFDGREVSTPLPQPVGDLVVYRGAFPMEAFGMGFGTWALSLDAEREKEGHQRANGAGAPPDPAAIETAITDSLARSGLGLSEARPLYFVQGANVPEELLAGDGGPPLASLPERWAARVREMPNGPVRRYLWLTRTEWSGDMALHYFLRVYRSGGDLSLEMHGVYQPPVGARHRWVDRVPPRSLATFLQDLALAPFAGIAMMAGGLRDLFVEVNTSLARVFANPTRAIARRARNTANYDFGAEPPLRRKAADPAAMSFFHAMDRRLDEAALTGRIMRVFIDHLDALGIDTTELREQRSTIMNQGIIVNNGDVNAQNVAAGLGARITQQLRGQQGQKKGAAA